VLLLLLLFFVRRGGVSNIRRAECHIMCAVCRIILFGARRVIMHVASALLLSSAVRRAGVIIIRRVEYTALIISPVS
jgi:hypothetical protein